MKKLTYEYVKNYFDEQGCDLLEKEYKNNIVEDYIFTNKYLYRVSFVFVLCHINVLSAERFILMQMKQY